MLCRDCLCREPTKDITLKRIAADGITLNKLQTMTEEDPILRVIPFINGHLPAKAQLTNDLWPYYHICGDLHVKDGCLAQDLQFVVPISLRSEILQQVHLGHPGVTQMKRLLRKSYWWPQMATQVEELVAWCTGCQFSEKSLPPVDILKVVIP